MAPGYLQGGAEERHQGRRQEVELTAEQGDGPGLALAFIGFAQLFECRADGGVGRCRVAREQCIQPGQPGAFAHQQVVGQRRHAVLAALAQALGVERGQGRRVVQQRLLEPAETGDQPQVVAHRVPLGQLQQTLAAAGEQVARQLVQVRGNVGGGFDLPRLKNGA